MSTAPQPERPIIARLNAAVKRLKDPKRPTKSLRITRDQHAAICAATSDKEKLEMRSEFTLPDGIVCPPGPFGHWSGMRFVIVTGHNDLDEVEPRNASQ